MYDSIRTVKEIAPNARLDTCPYEGGEDSTGYFIRIGLAGHWLSKARKNPRAAWANAATRMRKNTREQSNTHEEA